MKDYDPDDQLADEVRKGERRVADSLSVEQCFAHPLLRDCSREQIIFIVPLGFIFRLKSLPSPCLLFISSQCTNKSVCVFLVATYTDGTPTENAEWFCKWLEEASTDFRYGKTYLKGLRYAVFGLGNSVYVGHYNTVRRDEFCSEVV